MISWKYSVDGLYNSCGFSYRAGTCSFWNIVDVFGPDLVSFVIGGGTWWSRDTCLSSAYLNGYYVLKTIELLAAVSRVTMIWKMYVIPQVDEGPTKHIYEGKRSEVAAASGEASEVPGVIAGIRNESYLHIWVELRYIAEEPWMHEITFYKFGQYLLVLVNFWSLFVILVLIWSFLSKN